MELVFWPTFDRNHMSDKLMMTIARAINDVVLVVLKTPEILEPIGILQEKFLAKVLGYDETGLWVQFPISNCRRVSAMTLNLGAGIDAGGGCLRHVRGDRLPPCCIFRTYRDTTIPARSIGTLALTVPAIRRNPPRPARVSTILL